MHSPAYCTVPDHLAEGESFPATLGALRDMGLAGVGLNANHPGGMDRFADRIHEVIAAKLQLNRVSLPLDLRATIAADGFHALTRQLSGQRTLLSISLISHDPHDKPSAPRATGQAAAIVHQLSDCARATGLTLVLEPRAGT